MAEVHTVSVGLKKLNGGQLIAEDATIRERLEFTTEHRVLPNPNVPNSANTPSIEDYLIAEAADGFEPKYIGQYMIVTFKP
jgi:hypothetical protein